MHAQELALPSSEAESDEGCKNNSDRGIVSPRKNLKRLLGSLEFKRKILSNKKKTRKNNLADLISDREIKNMRKKIWTEFKKE